MNSRVIKIILMGTMLVHVGSLWAADEPENPITEDQLAEDPPLEPSDSMQSWQEEWRQDDDDRSDWTWFGMGYESRHRASQNRGYNSGGASQGPGSGKGPGSGGGHGPGGRNR
ncbi:MAG: hypothetical protein P8171_07965 [Candidatus Thiodiazotropha sp.]|jgi:hypothetical protein